jgi:hypothetical protein
MTAGAQLLQHLFAIPLLLSPRVSERAPQETYYQYKQGSLHRGLSAALPPVFTPQGRERDVILATS